MPASLGTAVGPKFTPDTVMLSCMFVCGCTGDSALTTGSLYWNMSMSADPRTATVPCRGRGGGGGGGAHGEEGRQCRQQRRCPAAYLQGHRQKDVADSQPRRHTDDDLRVRPGHRLRHDAPRAIEGLAGSVARGGRGRGAVRPRDQDAEDGRWCVGREEEAAPAAACAASAVWKRPEVRACERDRRVALRRAAEPRQLQPSRRACRSRREHARAVAGAGRVATRAAGTTAPHLWVASSCRTSWLPPG